MDRRRTGNKQKGKKEGKANTDTNRWRSPRKSCTSLEFEPSQSQPSGRPHRRRSRVDFDLGESSVENSVYWGCEAKEKELARLLEELSIKNKIKEEYEEMKAKYEIEKRLKDEAPTRLSAMASNNLHDNKQSTADLSDPNRPTRIAEKLSELYDNEWTDAFDALNDEMSETETIDFLLDILMRSYKACKAIASENYFEKVQRIIEFPVQGEQSVTTSCVLPDKLKQQIKEFRKLRAVHVFEDVKKVIRSNQPSKFDSVEAVMTYKSVCEELCWLMAYRTHHFFFLKSVRRSLIQMSLRTIQSEGRMYSMSCGQLYS